VRELKAHKNNTSELKNERKKESTGTKIRQRTTTDPAKKDM
jgi:hypothetical protein